jgi:hypothetical protein
VGLLLNYHTLATDFWKNKGKKITDDTDYANWILSTDFPVDTKAIIKTLLET